MRLYRVFPLLVAFSHSHSSFFHFVISLSLDPTTDIVLLPNKTPKCSAAAHWRHSPIELLYVRDKEAWCAVEKEDDES